MKNQLDLCARLGIADFPLPLLNQAFTHASYVHERNLPVTSSNERLEFLGDALLELAVTEELYKRYPDMTEGSLTELRARLVCRENLAMKAEGLDLGACMQLGVGEKRTGGSNKPALLADAMEALFGALFTHYGYEFSAKIAIDILLPADDLLHTSTGSDHLWKSRFQELVQREGSRNIEYVMSQSGADHQPLFTASLKVDGVFYGHGKGKTKQEAQQAAAKEGVARLMKELPPRG